MRVGILGGGQLGRMMAQEAHRLGLTPVIYTPHMACACEVTDQVVIAPYEDQEALRRFAESVDVCTFEVEHVPLEAVELVARVTPVHPNPAALAPTRDRLLEKRMLRESGIPTAPFVEVSTPAQARAVGDALGYPALLKIRTGGYDGRGMALVHSADEAEAAFAELGLPCIAEGWVPWTREVSVIGVREIGGRLSFYVPGENHHEDGILRSCVVPAPGLSAEQRMLLERQVGELMAQLDYVGVMAVEYFDTPDGLVANEIAPRVHNSGHWTQDGAVTSQFENHVRAIAGLPAGDVALRAPTAMVNIIGTLPGPAVVLAEPSWRLHLYGKSERAGRKIGHINACAADAEALAPVLEALRAVCDAR